VGPDPDRWQRRFYQVVLVAGLSALALWLVVRLRVITAPLIVGALLAWALQPVVRWLRRNRVPEFLALTVPLLAVTALVFIVVAVILPAALAELVTASQNLPSQMQNTILGLDPWFDDLIGVKLSALIAPDVLRANIQGVLREIVGSASSLVGWVLASARDILLAVGNLLLVFVIAAFVLDDYERIIGRVTELVPMRHRDHAARVGNRIDATLRSFLRAELLLWVLASSIFTAGLLVLRVPMAALLGPFVAAIYLVPYIGVIFGLTLALAVALVESPTLATFAGVSILFGGFYSIDAVFITPRVIGGRVGLRPLVVLLGIVAGGELFGVIGVLLAIPLLAVGRILLLEFLDKYRNSDAYLAVPAGSPEQVSPPLDPLEPATQSQPTREDA